MEPATRIDRRRQAIAITVSVVGIAGLVVSAFARKSVGLTASAAIALVGIRLLWGGVSGRALRSSSDREGSVRQLLDEQRRHRSE